MIAVEQPPLTRLAGLTPIQAVLLDDFGHRFTCTPAGRRSRKTLIGKCKTLYRAIRKPGRYLCGAPTRDQAKGIFWEWLKRETGPFRDRLPNETELSVRMLNGSEIRVFGLDKSQRVEGQPWDGMHLTEMPDMKPGAWGKHLRPLLSDTRGWAYLDGVPDPDAPSGGFGDWRDLCVYAAGGQIPETLPGVGAYAENPADPEWAYYHWFSSDVLPASEIEAAKRQLDEATFRTEYEGSFETAGGLAYYSFGPHNLKAVKFDKSRPIHIGMDFNYNPMCSIAAQEYRGEKSTDVYILEAFRFTNCDTAGACEKIISHFGPDKHYTVYPDPACQTRSTHGEGGKTDLAIIRNTFSRAQADTEGTLRIRVRASHPLRKDRLNAVNAKLKNAAGETSLYVNPRCKALIDDFQKIPREQYLGGNIADPFLGHSSDGLGYYIENRFPVTVEGNRNHGLIL